MDHDCLYRQNYLELEAGKARNISGIVHLGAATLAILTVTSGNQARLSVRIPTWGKNLNRESEKLSLEVDHKRGARQKPGFPSASTST